MATQKKEIGSTIIPPFVKVCHWKSRQLRPRANKRQHPSSSPAIHVFEEIGKNASFLRRRRPVEQLLEINVWFVMLDRFSHPVLIVDVQFGGVIVDHLHRLVRAVADHHHRRFFQTLEHVAHLVRHLVFVFPSAHEQRRLERPLFLPSTPLIFRHEAEDDVVSRDVANVQCSGKLRTYVLRDGGVSMKSSVRANYPTMEATMVNKSDDDDAYL